MTEENEVVQGESLVQESQTEHVEEAHEEVRKEEPPKSNADHNWSQVNEVLKLQKKKIEELETRLTEKQSAIPPEPEEVDEFANLDPDNYLTVDMAKKMAEKLAEKKATQAARKIVGEYIQQQNIQNDEQKTRSKYEDYDYVIENFAIPLIKNDPALAYKIQQSKNPADTAYKLGKLSDSYEEQSMKQQTSPKAEKILKNTSRPVSSNAVGSPLKNQADQFSKLSPQETWAMSQKFARGA